MNSRHRVGSVLPAREQGKAFTVSIKYLLCVCMVSVQMCVQRPWPEVPGWVLGTELTSCTRAPSVLNHVCIGFVKTHQSVFRSGSALLHPPPRPLREWETCCSFRSIWWSWFLDIGHSNSCVSFSYLFSLLLPLPPLPCSGTECRSCVF